MPCESRHTSVFAVLLWQQVILDLILFELKHLPVEWNRQRKVESKGRRREVEGKTAKQVAGERRVGREWGGEGEATRQDDHLKLRFEEDERQRGCRERSEGRRVDWR